MPIIDCIVSSVFFKCFSANELLEFFVFMFQPFLSRYVCVQGGCIILNPPPLFLIFFLHIFVRHCFSSLFAYGEIQKTKTKNKKCTEKRKETPPPAY